ncbi:MAG: hypothetical protein LBC74_08385 [Planctomycetaceae bacterium]|nr:hypothetical protein [Planctomycetaceae bacterium]
MVSYRLAKRSSGQNEFLEVTIYEFKCVCLIYFLSTTLQQILNCSHLNFPLLPPAYLSESRLLRSWVTQFIVRAV